MISTLPVELWDVILEGLPIPDAAKSGMVCRTFWELNRERLGQYKQNPAKHFILKEDAVGLYTWVQSPHRERLERDPDSGYPYPRYWNDSPKEESFLYMSYWNASSNYIQKLCRFAGIPFPELDRSKVMRSALYGYCASGNVEGLEKSGLKCLLVSFEVETYKNIAVYYFQWKSLVYYIRRQRLIYIELHIAPRFSLEANLNAVHWVGLPPLPYTPTVDQVRDFFVHAEVEWFTTYSEARLDIRKLFSRFKGEDVFFLILDIFCIDPQYHRPPDTIALYEKWLPISTACGFKDIYDLELSMGVDIWEHQCMGVGQRFLDRCGDKRQHLMNNFVASSFQEDSKSPLKKHYHYAVSLTTLGASPELRNKEIFAALKYNVLDTFEYSTQDHRRLLLKFLDWSETNDFSMEDLKSIVIRLMELDCLEEAQTWLTKAIHSGKK